MGGMAAVARVTWGLTERCCLPIGSLCSLRLELPRGLQVGFLATAWRARSRRASRALRGRVPPRVRPRAMSRVRAAVASPADFGWTFDGAAVATGQRHRTVTHGGVRRIVESRGWRIAAMLRLFEALLIRLGGLLQFWPRGCLLGRTEAWQPQLIRMGCLPTANKFPSGTDSAAGRDTAQFVVATSDESTYSQRGIPRDCA